ncbi:Probable G-protein coupled receptor 150 [Apodemus speciosus]|uniref:Probable G-protein coupled receptor 150 n=1 Tax=Apodemus speciosus TaxID=105296 RepID=A0ABQ0FH77_APOSI
MGREPLSRDRSHLQAGHLATASIWSSWGSSWWPR